MYRRLESKEEEKLVKLFESRGSKCLKFTPTQRGYPDRIVLHPDGTVEFIEVKRRGEKPRELQMKRAMELSDMGFSVRYYDGEFHSYENIVKENSREELW